MPRTQDLNQSDPVKGTLRDSVPIIDARDLFADNADRFAAASAAVGQACRQTGFFYLSHAFDHDTIYTDVQRQMERFFALPDSAKAALRSGDGPEAYGWEPLMSEPSYQPGTVANMESLDFSFRDELNRWPELENFRQCIHRYRETLSEVATAILQAMADAAGLDRNFFAKRCQSHELNTLRLIHYPEREQASSDQDVGISAHTDFECITLISQTAAGLELLDATGHWYDAPADDSTLVVILGDMLERWTNGYYRATGHRVRDTAWRRYSTVIFFAADDDVTIKPLPHFIDDANPPRYEPVGQRDHIDSEIARAVANRDVNINRMPDDPASH